MHSAIQKACEEFSKGNLEASFPLSFPPQNDYSIRRVGEIYGQ